MAAAEREQLEFRGNDATECEAFINAVSRRAFSLRKQRDDQWMAEFASSCFAHGALRWWNSLDNKTQRSWKLLRNAMLLRYRPTFCGGGGEEAERFVRMIRQTARDQGKLKDNDWIVELVSTCLDGEALRWHASLALGIQNNWTSLQQAIFVQYPRTHLIPTPAAAAPMEVMGSPLRVSRRSGRIRVVHKDGSHHYVSRQFEGGGFKVTSSVADSLTVQLDWPSQNLQKLSIRNGQCQSYNTVGVKWPTNGWSVLCPINSTSGLGPGEYKRREEFGSSYWKISIQPSNTSENLDLELSDKTGYVYPYWTSGPLYFDSSQEDSNCSLMLELL